MSNNNISDSFISFNVPPYVGGELENIKDAVLKHKICGDGEYTKKCQEEVIQKMAEKSVKELDRLGYKVILARCEEES